MSTACTGAFLFFLDRDRIIGLGDPVGGGAISIEPGGQFELSGAPVETIHQSLVVANTAITELKYRDAQDITLYRFNSVPHLQSRALVTHR